MAAQSKHETAVRVELEAAQAELDEVGARVREVVRAQHIAEARVDILQAVLMRAERAEGSEEEGK